MNILTSAQGPDEQLVGGKFAKQVSMIEAGIPVPAFYCLTKTFYEEVFALVETEVGHCLEEIDFNDPDTIRGAAKDIATIFQAVELSEVQKKWVLSAFDAQFEKDDLVSVRASTVGKKIEESEDSADNPFAGMSESFLYVKRDQVLDCIKQCWASGFSEESLMYRYAQNFDLSGFSVAVGIQKMVMGERSFVMFTCDPKTAARDTVIVAGYGIGEGVVQEAVPVDHYFVSGKTSDIDKQLADKNSQLTLDVDKGYGLIKTAVEEDLRQLPCLSDEQIRRMVEMGKKIEALFGNPQDTEGCFTANGELYFLQSRPISLDYGRQQVFSNANVTESFPGVCTVLTYTFAKFFYREIFYDLYRRLGVKRNKLRDNFEPLDKMIGFLGGRIYYCLTAFYLLHSQSPLFPIFKTHWENMIGLRTSYQTQNTSKLSALWQKIKTNSLFGATALYVLFDFITHNRKMYAYHQWWEKLIAPLRGKSFDDEDPYVAVQTFTKVWREVGNEWGVTLTTDAYMIPLYGWLESIFSKWNLDEDSGLLSDLLCGDEKLQSVEILLSAVRLAELVRNDKWLSDAFSNKTDEQIYAAHQAGSLGCVFSQKLDHHLHYYGDRGLQELKLEVPSVRDNPTALICNIRQFVSQTINADTIQEHEAEVRIQADKNLSLLLKGKPVKRFILHRLLKVLRGLISHRENSRYCRSELFGFSKKIFKGIAVNFVKSGVLEKSDDIFHLTQEEIFGYIDGSGVTENLQVLADLRRDEYNENLKKETKDDITTLGPVRNNVIFEDNAEVNEASGVMKGLGSSAGKVIGRARVVLDPMSVKNIAEDEILIARETDPGWLFLMLGSKGMVVERGSMLSHTAITGRKFGIPTVVALPYATTRIPDGALIEMDGSSGVVRLLDQNEEVA